MLPFDWNIEYETDFVDMRFNTYSSADVNHFVRHWLWYRWPHEVTTIWAFWLKLIEQITHPTVAFESFERFAMMKMLKCLLFDVQNYENGWRSSWNWCHSTGYFLHITHCNDDGHLIFVGLLWNGIFVHLRFRYWNIAFDDIVRFEHSREHNTLHTFKCVAWLKFRVRYVEWRCIQFKQTVKTLARKLVYF